MKLGLLDLKSYNLEICSYILIYFKLLLSLISSEQFLPVEGFHTLGWSTVTALAAVCCRTDGFYAILLSRFSNILLLHSVQLYQNIKKSEKLFFRSEFLNLLYFAYKRWNVVFCFILLKRIVSCCTFET